MDFHRNSCDLIECSLTQSDLERCTKRPKCHLILRGQIDSESLIYTQHASLRFPLCQSCSCQKRAKTRRWSRRVKWSRASAGSSALPSNSRPCWEARLHTHQHTYPQRVLGWFSVQALNCYCLIMISLLNMEIWSNLCKFNITIHQHLSRLLFSRLNNFLIIPNKYNTKHIRIIQDSCSDVCFPPLQCWLTASSGTMSSFSSWRHSGPRTSNTSPSGSLDTQKALTSSTF